MLATIFKDKKLTTSADGSIIFYSLAYAEAYRAKSIGAYTESLHKFVKSSGVLEKTKDRDLRILDLCFGLGYNCAVTFEHAARVDSTNRVHIVSVEMDAHLIELVNSLNILFPVKGYQTVRQCLKEGRSGRFSMEMYNIDALTAIYNINGHFDAIYFDPFSISKNPEMWSVAVFRRLRELLADDGVLVTYACGKSARKNMTEAGLIVEDTASAVGAFHPGTRARKCSSPPPWGEGK
ncbi:MAG: hypothetical protein LBV09_03440 [Deferribacteraceae bacterium]|jgi:chorismate dehydratase|nr:hypothetical protein [Deferribacteraceae bacterium]